MRERKRHKGLPFWIVASLVFIIWATMAYGGYQSSTSYIIHTDVLSGGGGDMSPPSAPGHSVSSTLGQPTPIGISEVLPSGSSYKNWAGFWFPSIYYTPTAVFLSSFRAYEDGGQVVVEWETASEIGTVGFYLFRQNPNTGKYRRVNRRLLPGLLISPQGGVYRCVDERANPDNTLTYMLVEKEVKGRERIYGPFTVTVGEEGIGAPTAAFAQYGMTVRRAGQSRKARRMSARKLARIESRKRTRQMASAFRAPGRGKVKIAIKQNGLYYLDSYEIADVMGQSIHSIRGWINSRRLILKNQGKKVAWLAAEGNRGIYFYGEAIENIYTSENVYWLKKGRRGQGLPMKVVEGAGPAPARGDETFVETTHAEEDHSALTSLFDDPQADYWMWDYIVAGDSGNGSKTFPVSLNAVAQEGNATLKISLQGATDTGSTTDHHVQVFLNGNVIGEATWGGASAYEMVCDFDQSLLNEGENSIEVTGLLDTGVPYSIFYVDSFDVTYRRYYQSVADRAFVRGDENTVITNDGFSGPDIFVFDLANPRKPELINATTVDGEAGNYRVSFVPATPDRLYLAVNIEASMAPVSMAPDTPSRLKRRRNRADYLVITPSELRETAERLADYREGRALTTKVVELEDIYDEFNYGISNPEAIRDFLSYAYHKWRKAPRYVVLVGEGTYDFKDNQGYGDNLLPSMMVATPYGLFASDNHLVDVDGDDGVPDMAIGRLPVMTAEELDIFIDKIMAYESAGGQWRKRTLMLADDPDDGGDFPGDSDAVAALLPPEYAAEKVYLSEHTRDEARQLVREGINNGALFMNYIGHAGVDRLSKEGMLMESDVDFLTNGDRLPVMTAMTCVAGQFAIPGYDSLSEVLVLHQDGGAVAAWSPTGLSMNDQAVILDKALFHAVFQDEERTLGDAVLKALGDYSLSGTTSYMLDIYNLLGDPALEMR